MQKPTAPDQKDLPLQRFEHLEQLEHELFLYRMMVNATLDSITLIDRSYIYRIVNQAYIEARQLRREDIVNHSVAEVWGEKIFEQVIREKLDACFGGRTVSHASAYEFQKNEINYIETIYTPCFAADGEVSHAVVISHNITELKQSQEKIETLAYYDALTQLPSRPLFIELLNREINNAKRKKGALVVFFLDLDEFKKTNDIFGHSVGDELLACVGDRLKKYLRQSDTLGRPGGVISLDHTNASDHFARIGGDEFTLIVPNISDKKFIGVIAERILNLFNEPFSISDREIFITTSIGIALFPEDGQNVEALLKNADTALYKAKAVGRNTFRFYSSEMNKKAEERIQLEGKMRYAIQNDEFRLHYQPLYNIDTAQLVGMEALIRWHNKDMGMVSPRDFIPLAEENGMINQIGEWVIHTACRQAKIWQDQGSGKLKLCVNLSTRQFFDPHVVSKIRAALENNDFDPSCLELEITETAIMKDMDGAMHIMNELKKLGINISLDDFGTGFSSLIHLKMFHINTLKIDQVFIRNADFDGRDGAIISAIIEMCHNLKIDVVAEGVESKESLDFLKRKNCHLAQGFFFSPPLAVDKFESLLSARAVDSSNNQEAGTGRIQM